MITTFIIIVAVICKIIKKIKTKCKRSNCEIAPKEHVSKENKLEENKFQIYQEKIDKTKPDDSVNNQENVKREVNAEIAIEENKQADRQIYDCQFEFKAELILLFSYCRENLNPFDFDASSMQSGFLFYRQYRDVKQQAVFVRLKNYVYNPQNK